MRTSFCFLKQNEEQEFIILDNNGYAKPVWLCLKGIESKFIIIELLEHSLLDSLGELSSATSFGIANYHL